MIHCKIKDALSYGFEYVFLLLYLIYPLSCPYNESKAFFKVRTYFRALRTSITGK